MVLAHHLKHNLWLDNEQEILLLRDSISADLDVAMIVRREGIPGQPTPDGILTRFETTTLGRIVKEIEASSDPATIDLGFMLLTLSEATVMSVSENIDRIMRMAKIDGKGHDFTASIVEGKSIGEGRTGLTIHCNNDHRSVAFPRLYGHCTKRKSTHQADSWFGLCLSPENAMLRFGLNL